MQLCFTFCVQLSVTFCVQLRCLCFHVLCVYVRNRVCMCNACICATAYAQTACVDMEEFEDKTLTILRRKFLMGIPLSMGVGYMCGGLVGRKLSFGVLPFKIAGFVCAPILSSMLIVHFNRAEIYRVGSGIVAEMEQLRKTNSGPFADQAVRDQWDTQMQRRKLTTIPQMETTIDYEKIVKDSVSK